MMQLTPKPQWKSLATLLAVLALFVLSTGCGSSEAQANPEDIAAMQRLADREAEIAERERAAAQREAAITEHALEITERLERLEQRQAELEQLNADLASRSAGLTRRESDVARREAELGTSTAQLTQDREALAESRATAERQAEEREAARRAEAARRNPPAVYTEVSLQADTLLDVELLTTVSSASSHVGDTFRTRLIEDLVADGGRLVVPAGTELVGQVTQAVPLKRVGGQAQLGLQFGELMLPWGRTVEINASFFDAGRNQSRRSKKVIGGAAAGGAVLGRILDDDDRGRGTVLGAILGAAIGTAAAANRPGDEIEIPGGTVVTLRLDEPVTVAVPWKSRFSAP
ncbi:MAG: hypothetical protein AAF560_04790 [Acidobacteriota bacterium]